MILRPEIRDLITALEHEIEVLRAENASKTSKKRTKQVTVKAVEEVGER
jgi:hypothetical protein